MSLSPPGDFLARCVASLDPQEYSGPAAICDEQLRWLRAERGVITLAVSALALVPVPLVWVLFVVARAWGPLLFRRRK